MTDLISSLATEQLSVSRFAAGVWSQTTGKYEKGTQSTLTVTASVQPLSPNEILQQPEHRRNREMVKIYTKDRLYTSDEKKGTPADVVTHDGKRYEIHRVDNWSIGTDIPHYKSIGVMIDGEGSGRQ